MRYETSLACEPASSAHKSGLVWPRSRARTAMRREGMFNGMRLSSDVERVA